MLHSDAERFAELRKEGDCPMRAQGAASDIHAIDQDIHAVRLQAQAHNRCCAHDLLLLVFAPVLKQ